MAATKIKPADLLKLSLTPAANFIKTLEGFSSKPYWDVRQWTWGYGTKAPSGTGTITPASALRELQNYLSQDAAKISKALRVPISENAFVGLLSFSYNLGFGRVKVLIDDLNKGVSPALVAVRLKKYIYADGVPSDGLITRREKEAAKLLS